MKIVSFKNLPEIWKEGLQGEKRHWLYLLRDYGPGLSSLCPFTLLNILGLLRYGDEW